MIRPRRLPGMSRIARRCVTAIVMMTGVLSFATSAAASPALVRPAALVPGSAPAGARPLGALPSSQKLQISVVLEPSNSGQLQSLLQGLYDPHSPRYHQWLRPGEFMQRFGPSRAEVGAVESWLHGKGLTTTLSGFAVRASAPEAQVAAGLGTSFKEYVTRSGRQGYLAQSAPQVPQSLAGGQITAILGLNTVVAAEPESTFSSTSTRSAEGSSQPHTDGLTPCTAAQSDAGASGYTLDSLGATYGIGSLLADGQDGHGETIGVFEGASSSSTDVATYERLLWSNQPSEHGGNRRRWRGRGRSRDG